MPVTDMAQAQLKALKALQARVRGQSWLIFVQRSLRLPGFQESRLELKGGIVNLLSADRVQAGW